MSNSSEDKKSGNDTGDCIDLVPQTIRRSTDRETLLLQLAAKSPGQMVRIARIMAKRDIALTESDNRTAIELARIELAKARLKTREYASPPPPSPPCPISPREDSIHGNRANVFLIATTIAAAALAVAMGVDQYQAYRNKKQDEAYNALHNKLDVGKSRILPTDDDPIAQISINNRADLEENLVQRFENLFDDKDVFVDSGLIAWRENEGRRLIAYCTDCCSEGYTCGNLINLDIRGSYLQDGIPQPPYVSVSSRTQYGNDGHEFGAIDIGGDGLVDMGFVSNTGELQLLDEPDDQDSAMNTLLDEIDSRTQGVLSL